MAGKPAAADAAGEADKPVTGTAHAAGAVSKPGFKAATGTTHTAGEAGNGLRYLLPVILLTMVLASCMSPGPRPLRGFTVVVDPGHGGTALTDSFRVGPTGEREEWVNLRVSLHLRDLLEKDGARVLMTRTEDDFVELADRARLAVENQADVFVSVHHNATADTSVNFPIIYFHGNASQNKASVLLGRFIGRELAGAMFDGETPVSLVSDFAIFPTRGTGVLRGSYGIPGVISEASFFTNAAEEDRLKRNSYNRAEAEALHRAISAFLLSERPEARIIEPYEQRVEPLPVLEQAERMKPEALLWREDVEFGRSVMNELAMADVPIPDRESGTTGQAPSPGSETPIPGTGGTASRVYELSRPLQDTVTEALHRLTRSVQSFPDSYLAREAHRMRAVFQEILGESPAAAQTRLRTHEFFPDTPVLEKPIPMQMQLPEDLTLSVLIQAPDGTELFAHQADRQVPSASVIKTPILVTLLQMAAKGDIDLSETYTLTEADIVGGTGDLQHEGPGLALSWLDYARLMIKTSDNVATNVIIAKVGMDAVNALTTSLEMDQTVLARYMMDTKAIEEGRQNYTSPRDMNRLLLALYHGRILDAPERALFWDMLKDCDDDTMLRAGVPPQYTVANKTGILSYVRGDSGVLFGQQDFIITAFAEDFNDVSRAEQAIADVVRSRVE